MASKPQRIPTTELHLDRLNPRLSVGRNPSQAQLRRQLIEHADVIPLAKKIMSSEGLNPGERIVVTEENGHWVVLEGNRRTTACQIIADPSLCPEEYRGRLGIIPPAVQKALQSVPVDVVPDRDAALPMIANRHAGRGILRWKPEMRTRFVGTMHDQGKSIESISETLKLSPSEVRKALLSYHLMRRVRRMDWTDDEQSQLEREHELKTNPFTRLFESAGGRAAFPFEIDAQGSLRTRMTAPQQEAAIRGAARAMLFNSPGDTRPQYNTRDAPEHILSTIAKAEPAAAPLVAAAQAPVSASAADQPAEDEPEATQRGARPKAAKPAQFFEGFVCSGTADDWCLHLSDEIRKIPWRSLKNAAGFLLRALLEASMVDALRVTGFYARLRKEWQEAGKTSSHPDLSFIMEFVKTNAQQIFTDQAAPSILKQIDRHARVLMNLSIHGKLRLSEQDLIDAAGHMRRFLITIHDRTGLVMPGKAAT